MKKLLIGAVLLSAIVGGTVSRASVDRPTDFVTRAEMDNQEESRVKMLERLQNSTVIINVRRDGEERQGSGFFVAPNWIMTAAHVVYGEPEMIRITMKDATNCVIQSKTVDLGSDWALMEVSSCEGVAIPVNYEPRIGQDVYALGNPAKYDFTITRGIVGNTNGQFLQFDANVQGGNSGGPLVNSKGEVIGVVVAHGLAEDGTYDNNGVNMATFMRNAKWNLENVVGVE